MNSKKTSAREAAFQILSRVEKDNAYSNLMLSKYFAGIEISPAEKSLTYKIVLGVLERLITLDYVLINNLEQPLKKLKPQVLTILRMGAYQILYLEKIPDFAAVNESIKLAKINGCSFATSLINAVLRNISRHGIKLPEYLTNPVEYYEIKYSFPKWLVEHFIFSYGEESAKGIMESTLESSRLFARVNTIKTDGESLKEKLKSEEIDVKFLDFPVNSFEIIKSPDLSELLSFKTGLFYIQDISSQLCAFVANPKPGDIVIDVCAAPGGKSFLMAQIMENTGEINACDIYEHKLRLIENAAYRLGIKNISTFLRDATKSEVKFQDADVVVCDVPCSGLGVIRRKPEIKYNSSQSLESLPELQYQILSNSSLLVKPGGTLVYSTCTLNPFENEKVCERFLLNNKEFSSLKVLPQVERADESNFLTLFPHIHNTDGFFIAQFTRAVIT